MGSQGKLKLTILGRRVSGMKSERFKSRSPPSFVGELAET
jgi:hypothetical protein